MAHLFPGDGDEHGAIVLAGIAERGDRLRLLVREVLLAEDGVDYVPGTRGYRALHPLFVAKGIQRARDLRLAYLAVHCHGGVDRVAFSATDVESHDRGYPALVDISGNPVGALVFARDAVAGDLFTADGRRLNRMSVTVIGKNFRTLFAHTVGPRGVGTAGRYDRQARLFGDAGQERLAGLRVGVIGAGGAGLLAVHMLARLGVGSMVVVDPDRIDSTNLPRMPGVPSLDAMTWADTAGVPRWLRGWAKSHRRYKVDRARRIVRQANDKAEVVALPVSVDDATAVAELITCDVLVLAADSQLARHVANAICHAYLIPMFQVGVKVPVTSATGAVGDIFVVARRVNPDSGCLWCNGLIDPTALQLEALGEEGVRAAAYLDEPEVVAPSVITLNGLAVAQALNDLLFAVTGLHCEGAPGRDEGDDVPYVRFMPRRPTMVLDSPRKESACFHCSATDRSILSMGDAATLPAAQSEHRTAGARRRR
jgi:molybdopterin/thiamine biosynthesis adenylyltransferase